MSEVCFKEFKGWCKSFTKTEIYLSLLQVIFLILLIAFITFLVLHLIACVRHKHEIDIQVTTGSPTERTKLSPTDMHSLVPTVEPTVGPTIGPTVEPTIGTTVEPTIGPTVEPTIGTTVEPTIRPTVEPTIGPTIDPTIEPAIEPTQPFQPSTRATLGKGIECTWTPSKKTDAFAHYYEGRQVVTVASPSNVNDKLESKTEKSFTETFKSDTTNRLLDIKSDVDIVDNVRKRFLLALVKIRHPRNILFGCTLTIVSNHWTLTAASCIEAIEEVDALDSFVMLERFGEESPGETHELSDVIIHPEYRGVNKSYDLVAIKSEDVLVKDSIQTVTLPTLVDNSLITLGERFGVLGFGKFSTEADSLDRRVHEVSVYKLVRSQCPGADTWAARHLTGGQAVGRAAAGASSGLCAGRVGAGAEAGASCPCGGAPLLRARTLLGVMSDDGTCGLSCRPALYVDLALRRDWLDSVLRDD